MVLKIVILDGYALNPGDLSWQPLQALGVCQIYERTPAELVIERAQDAAIILTNKVLLDRATLLQLPKLRYIGVTATGYNGIDIAAARELGIIVTNVPAYSTHAVAQFTFALLLELAHHVGVHAHGVRHGRWANSPDFCYWEHPLIELAGLTMGIIGYGNIGKAVALLASAFGMRVLIHSRTPIANDERFVALDYLSRESDVVSLHCPLTPETTELINAAQLATMKPTAFLINTSRGGLINEVDLAAALNAEKIAGAGLDVLTDEPPKANNPLLTAKNCIITPHIAWATKAARTRLMKTVVENLQAFLAGRPQNICV